MNPGSQLVPRILGSTRTCAACLRLQQSTRSCLASSLTFTNGFKSTIQNFLSPKDRLNVRGGRPFHTSRPAPREAEQPRQAVPLGDFYTDLLSSPLPSKARASTHLPTFVQPGGDRSKEERAKLLFGSIEGSGYERHTYDKPDATWRTINGVPVPPRPNEPDNCCMSGCVHCVWDDYRDDVEAWAARVAEAQARSPKKRARGGTPKIDMPRPEVDHASGSMDDDGGGSESLWTSPSSSADASDELFQGIPVGIREFMATEKKIKDRRRAKRERAASVDDGYT